MSKNLSSRPRKLFRRKAEFHAKTPETFRQKPEFLSLHVTQIMKKSLKKNSSIVWKRFDKKLLPGVQNFFIKISIYLHREFESFRQKYRGSRKKSDNFQAIIEFPFPKTNNNLALKLQICFIKTLKTFEQRFGVSRTYSKVFFFVGIVFFFN